MFYVKSPFCINPILLFNLKLIRYILLVNELKARQYLQYMTENWAEWNRDTRSRDKSRRCTQGDRMLNPLGGPVSLINTDSWRSVLVLSYADCSAVPLYGYHCPFILFIAFPSLFAHETIRTKARTIYWNIAAGVWMSSCEPKKSIKSQMSVDNFICKLSWMFLVLSLWWTVCLKVEYWQTIRYKLQYLRPWSIGTYRNQGKNRSDRAWDL